MMYRFCKVPLTKYIYIYIYIYIYTLHNQRMFIEEMLKKNLIFYNYDL